MARVRTRDHTVYLPPTPLSTSGMNHTCLYFPAAERRRTLAGTHFYSARNARIATAVLATAIPSVRPSVCLSVTRRYCVKTTACSTVQFAPYVSSFVETKKIFPGDDPFPPEILAQSGLPTPEVCEF